MDEELLSMKSFERYKPVDAGLNSSLNGGLDGKDKAPAFVTGKCYSLKVCVH